MRRFLFLVVAACLLVNLAGRALAGKEEQALLEKAIKAHGGQTRLEEFSAGYTRTKGNLELLGQSVPFTQEAWVQLPDKVKSVLELEMMGNKVRLTTVFDGKKGWIKVNTDTQDFNDKLLDAVREEMYVADKVNRLTPLLQEGFELAALGESTVNDRPVVGIKVSAKGHRDVQLFFDKESGLVLKSERRSVETTSGQEYTEEKVVSEYREVNGIKIPKKVRINKDGKKFMAVEEVETKFLQKHEDSVFGKP